MSAEADQTERLRAALGLLRAGVEAAGIADPGPGMAEPGPDIRRLVALIARLDAVEGGAAAGDGAGGEQVMQPTETEEAGAESGPPEAGPAAQGGPDVAGETDPGPEAIVVDDVAGADIAGPDQPGPDQAETETDTADGEGPDEIDGAAAGAETTPESMEGYTVAAPQPGGIPGFATPEASSPSPPRRSIHLRNARAGEAYSAGLGIDGLGDVSLIEDGGTGLTLDRDGLLTGVPLAHGDFTLILEAAIHGVVTLIRAELAVIPDPRTLWTSRPSDRSAPYWKPDEDYARTEADLLCVAASKRGRSHARDGGFRDDDFCLVADRTGGWHVAAVADGAGSAKFSRYGSLLATETVMQRLPALLDEVVTPGLDALVDRHLAGDPTAEQEIRAQLLYRSLATVAFDGARAIEAEAASRGEPASSYSTTLVIGVARRIRPDLWFIAGFAIGDGGMAVFDVADGSLSILSQPDSGEYAGQTRFLQRSEFARYEDVSRRLFFDLRRDFTAIALMTDGITDPKFPTDDIFARPSRWAEFWTDDLGAGVDFSRGNPDLKAQLMAWLDFWSPGNHDDRTIALMLP